MLCHLKIENYALINKLNIDLNDGMTVITGETGAGKSILLDALGLLTGNRADTGVLQNKNNKCIVEAQFDTEGEWFKKFFDDHDLDNQSKSIIRREISNSGSSRAFINDTPVNLSQLKEIGAQLVDIHSQHQTLTLSEAFFKYKFIDTISVNIEKHSEYKIAFKKFKNLQSQLNTLLENEQQAKKDKDYYEFLLNEILEVKLKSGETEKLETEQKLLSNSQNILQVLANASNVLGEKDENIISQISKLKLEMNSIAGLNKSFESFNERFQSLYVELKDLCSEIEAEQEEINNDPGSLQYVDERLSAIFRLFKKHNIQTETQLLKIGDEFDDKLQSISNYDEQIEKLKSEIVKLEKSLVVQANELTKKRKAAATSISKNIKQNLGQLGMPDAEFIVDIQTTTTLNEFGNNEITFLFTANKGSLPKDLSKVASGGEMSRLMLCIKAMLVEKTALPTIIFDEIDTGVSGDIALKMGNIMFAMAQRMQLLTITHLAQIAAKGQHHLHVVKEVIDDKTNSNIIEIKEETRIQEIAKMLSSANPTKAAVENAKELLELKQ